jgi:hypothetical protein
MTLMLASQVASASALMLVYFLRLDMAWGGGEKYLLFETIKSISIFLI